MNFDNKRKLLENAKELARLLEEKTNIFVKVRIGWIEDSCSGVLYDVYIMVNHPDGWFGDGEYCWNEAVVWNSINNFHPVKKPYLVLNELIGMCY